jgi:hypothetical protein
MRRLPVADLKVNYFDVGKQTLDAAIIEAQCQALEEAAVQLETIRQVKRHNFFAGLFAHVDEDGFEDFSPTEKSTMEMAAGILRKRIESLRRQ